MFSRDPILTQTFKEGGDPHLQTATKILGKPAAMITKEERKLAKSVNFGFLYGMYQKKFKAYAFEKFDLDVTIEEARQYRADFFKTYAGLPAWHARMKRIVHNQQMVQSPTGRIRHLPSILSVDEDMQAEAERQAINSPVQGFASDMTVLAMTIIWGKLPKGKARMIGNVHDSIMIEAREEYADECAQMVKQVMENLPLKRMFGYQATIPIEADVTISQHWGEKD
jgi:DNA polymerase-1